MSTTKTTSKTVPILFSAPMVKAILNGTKTQTRRTQGLKEINKYPYKWKLLYQSSVLACFQNMKTSKSLCCKPKVSKGDVFWVRETWQLTDFLHPTDENYGYIYKASDYGREWQENMEGWKWKPSIFMPKGACRIFLEVTDVWVERLHDISEADAVAEGIQSITAHNAPNRILGWHNYTIKPEHGFNTFFEASKSFFSLWESINGQESLESNPWVWVYEFQLTERPIDFLK